MGINELTDEIARVIEQFAEEIAEQRLQEKEQKTGRCSKVKVENSEKGEGNKKGIYPDFPKTTQQQGEPAATRNTVTPCYKKKNEPSDMPPAAFGPVRLEFIGGGGGSRTRVRKYSPHVSTCLVPGSHLASGSHPEPESPDASLLWSRFPGGRRTGKTSPRSRRLHPALRARAGKTARQVMLPLRNYNRLRLYLRLHLFYELTEHSACNVELTYPRRIRFTPIFS